MAWRTRLAMLEGAESALRGRVYILGEAHLEHLAQTVFNNIVPPGFDDPGFPPRCSPGEGIRVVERAEFITSFQADALERYVARHPVARRRDDSRKAQSRTSAPAPIPIT